MLFNAAAGEPWDNLVAMAVTKNCAGIECLSGIPGTVGGTPVQNVWRVRAGSFRNHHPCDGAGDCHRPKLWCSTTRQCGFCLSHQRLQHHQNADSTSCLRSPTCSNAEGTPRIEYADLKKFFGDSPATPPTLQQVRDAVRSIRQSKAMLIVPGDEDCRSAGSFFKNPIVSSAEADRVESLAQQRGPRKKSCHAIR